MSQKYGVGTISHLELVKRGQRWLKNSRGCSVIITELGSGYEIPDVIGWRGGWSSIVLEAKASISDFRIDLSKSFRKEGGPAGMGALRYYIVSSEIKEKALTILPPKWGLLSVGKTSVFVECEAEDFHKWNWRGEMLILNSIIRRIATKAEPLPRVGIKYYEGFDDASENPNRELYAEPEVMQEV